MSIAGSCPIARCCEVEGASCAGVEDFGPDEQANEPNTNSAQSGRCNFIDDFSLSLAAHEVERRERQHFRRADQIVDAAVLVGLVRELELAGTVSDAMR